MSDAAKYVPTGVVPRRRKHGDLFRDGDEFNREPWYYCAKCNGNHGLDIAQCDGLREQPVGGTFSWERPAALDPIAKAIDDYLLMERKARAWDALKAWAEKDRYTASASLDYLLDLMDDLVHPAQETSSR